MERYVPREEGHRTPIYKLRIPFERVTMLQNNIISSSSRSDAFTTNCCYTLPFPSEVVALEEVNFVFIECVVQFPIPRGLARRSVPY